MILVDFTKAFDTMNWEALWNSPQKLGALTIYLAYGNEGIYSLKLFYLGTE